MMWRIQKVTRGRPYGGHVASSGRDTCQVDLAFLAYGWTSMQVTHVTTHRVTRGRLTSSDDVAADAAGRLGSTAGTRGSMAKRQVAVQWLMWHTRGPMTGRHMARFDWLVRVPRGPVKGCHVAPHYWFVVSMLKCWFGVAGGRTRDLRAGKGPA
jgi:hypothetical protein